MFPEAEESNEDEGITLAVPDQSPKRIVSVGDMNLPS